jgi:hypothetical protein
MAQSKKIYNENGKALHISDVSGSTIFREHCPFKDAPCNYTGRGWYDRCAWCKDNNSFIRKTDDKSKPFTV